MSGLVGRRVERWVGGQINRWVDELSSGLVDGSTGYPWAATLCVYCRVSGRRRAGCSCWCSASPPSSSASSATACAAWNRWTTATPWTTLTARRKLAARPTSLCKVHAPVCWNVCVWMCVKRQALVYGILPSTTAVFSYAIGSRKRSANEQFFVGAQTVVSLLQITQIKQGLSFIAANKVYTSTKKPQSFESRWNSLLLFLTRGGCVSCLRACFGARLLLQSN